LVPESRGVSDQSSERTSTVIMAMIMSPTSAAAARRPKTPRPTRDCRPRNSMMLGQYGKKGAGCHDGRSFGKVEPLLRESPRLEGAEQVLARVEDKYPGQGESDNEESQVPAQAFVARPRGTIRARGAPVPSESLTSAVRSRGTLKGWASWATMTLGCGQGRARLFRSARDGREARRHGGPRWSGTAARRISVIPTDKTKAEIHRARCPAARRRDVVRWNAGSPDAAERSERPSKVGVGQGK